MRLPPETWFWAVAQALLHAAAGREHVALGHAGGDAHGYSPTRPARLISVSSMSSMVDIARAEAW